MDNATGFMTLALVAMLAGCSPKQDDKQDEVVDAPAIPVLKLQNQDATLDHDYASNLEAVQNVEIRARVSGYLDRILVDEGKPVRKGQLLFQLNAAEYQVEVAQAQASMQSAIAQSKSAQVEMERVALLVNKNIVSKSELQLAKAKMDAARAAIDVAKASLQRAQLQVSLASIRAPFDGVINRIPFKRGSLIEEGALLTTVSDLGQIYAYFNVSEKEYLSFIKKRRNPSETTVQEVDLLLADDTPYPYPGKIETNETVFEGNSGTLAFRARFPNPKGLLRHGATGKVRLSTDVADALLVPQKSVFEVQDKNFVYVVDASNQIRTRSFVPGSRFDQFYIVKSGLKPGERIVYEGVQNLKDGMTISPRALPGNQLRALFTAAQ